MYQVKNINHGDWRNRKYMVIRNCNNECKPEWQGYWYWCSYNNLNDAFQEAKSLDNGMLVETSQVESIPC